MSNQPYQRMSLEQVLRLLKSKNGHQALVEVWGRITSLTDRVDSEHRMRGYDEDDRRVYGGVSVYRYEGIIAGGGVILRLRRIVDPDEVYRIEVHDDIPQKWKEEFYMEVNLLRAAMRLNKRILLQGRIGSIKKPYLEVRGIKFGDYQTGSYI